MAKKPCSSCLFLWETGAGRGCDRRLMETKYPLDTAAKLFPAVTRRTNTSVYRISAILKEEVCKETLQQAVRDTLKRYPAFAVKLTSTSFDQYFEPNDAPFFVKHEVEYPCALMKPEENNGYLFLVLYYGNRISLEAFHALADGAGAVEFLKTLLYRYFTLRGEKIDPEGKILLPEDTPGAEETEDALLKYYDADRSKVSKLPPAFKIKGTPYEPYGNNVLQGVVSVSALKAAAKRSDATITEYLTALLILAIYREAVREELDDEPIVISVPVNLRSLFPSKTVRNFFCILNLSVPIRTGMNFESILAEVQRQIREKTSEENLLGAIAESCGVMEHPVVKAVPRFMREAGTKFVFAFFGEDIKTMTLSNVGLIDLPAGLAKHVERAESIIYPTERSPINCCMCSVNGKLTISFIKTIKETAIIRYFFGFLARETGTDVEIYTNNWGICDEQV